MGTIQRNIIANTSSKTLLHRVLHGQAPRNEPVQQICVSKSQNTKLIFFFSPLRLIHCRTSSALCAQCACVSCSAQSVGRRSVPEVLDVVLYSAEAQSVGQGLVVGQSLS